MRRVLVTGATGFIGRALVPWLAERGWTVRAALRRPAENLAAGVEAVVVGDIGPDTSWQAALEGVDRVVHLAGRAHILREEDGNPLAAFRRVNVAGTVTLARAAAAGGVRRLVFLSSVKALAEEGGPAPVAAFEPPWPATPYGASKLEAEAGLFGLARASGLEGGGLEVAVLRPHLVYGPGVGANFARLMRLVDAGWPLPLGGLDNRRGILFVGNLIDAVGCVLDHPAAANRVYTLHDGEALSTPDLVRRLAAALGRPARLAPVPAGLVAAALEVLGKGEAWRRLAGSLAVDDDGLERDTGWRPPYDTDAGLALTAAWYRGRS